MRYVDYCFKNKIHKHISSDKWDNFAMPTYKIGSLKFYSNSKLFGLLFSFYGLKILKKLIYY